MKTIMDAVNELRGDLKNLENNENCGEYINYNDNQLNDEYLGYFSSFRSASSFSINVCTINEFRQCVSELQNWQPTKDTFSKFERDVEISLFGKNWVVGIIYDSYDTLHEFDIQLLSLCTLLDELQIDLTAAIDSCSSLNHQFECAVIAKIEEDRQNV